MNGRITNSDIADSATVADRAKDFGNHTETASGSTGNAPSAGMAISSKGMFMTQTYNDAATPVNFGNIINLLGNGSGQLLCEWTGADSSSGHLYYRSHRNTSTGGWGSWRKIIDDGNYTSYTVKKDGTGATGNNWAIGITGNAATSTTATTATKLATTQLTNQDLNTYTTSGTLFYGARGNTVTNKPSNVDAFGMQVFQTAGGYTAQLLFSSDTNNGIFWRCGSNSNLGSWKDLSVSTKLGTAKTITSEGEVVGSYSFDGSKNITYTSKLYNCHSYNGSTNTRPYHRIASLPVLTGSYQDRAALLYISGDYNGGSFGIVRISLRTNQSGSVSTAEVKWLVRYGWAEDAIQIGIYNVFGKTYADCFLKHTSTYQGIIVRAIGGTRDAGATKTWELHSTREQGTTFTECYSNIQGTTAGTAAQDLHSGQQYSTIVTGSDVGIVGQAIKDSAGNKISDSYLKLTRRNIIRNIKWYI